MLKRLGDVTSKAQYVLRGFGEDMQDAAFFASTNADSISTNAARVWYRSQERTVHSVLTADVKRAVLNASMHEVRRRCIRQASA